ncbi:DUF1016 N-terminal domain-containing protein [Streptomyces sp. NPDC088350]|uniref:DUF1016 N-terminal domain-containing protein n=1 Tax=Streptomyces sp. NPDC088350 TaxID=3365854 RepID=UPI003827AB46
MHKNTKASEAAVPAQLGSLPSWYDGLLGEVRETVAGARLRAQRAVKIELVGVYWQIGKLILARQEHEGWGTKVAGRLAADLKATFPNQRGFSRRNLIYMQKMARAWPEPIVQQPVAQLPWGHVTVLMDKLEARSEMDFYTTEAVRNGWPRALLDRFIHQSLHLAQGAAATNFEVTVPDDSAVLKELARDPYRLDFLGLDEHELEEAIVAKHGPLPHRTGRGFRLRWPRVPRSSSAARSTASTCSFTTSNCTATSSSS